MKTKLVLTVFLTSLLFFYGCSDNEESVQESELVSEGSPLFESTSSSKSLSKSKGSSVVSQNYPQAQAEVMETFGAIAKSIIEGDIEKLISFHAYGPKFTEFKDGALRNGGKDNEAYEREVFGNAKVLKFEANDPKVAVYYGNVANLTFHSDFILQFEGGDPFPVINQITLLFVKTKGKWKMVHEHHSPLN